MFQLNQYGQPSGFLSSKAERGIVNVHNDLNARCAQEDQIGTDKFVQMLAEGVSLWFAVSRLGDIPMAASFSESPLAVQQD